MLDHHCTYFLHGIDRIITGISSALYFLLRHNYFDAFIDSVLSVNVDVAGAFFLCFDHTLARHRCNLTVAALILDILMSCDWFVFDDLLRLDRKGLSDGQRDSGLVDLDGLGIAVVAADGRGMYDLGFCQPNLFTVHQLVGFDVIFVVGRTIQVLMDPCGRAVIFDRYKLFDLVGLFFCITRRTIDHIAVCTGLFRPL